MTSLMGIPSTAKCSRLQNGILTTVRAESTPITASKHPIWSVHPRGTISVMVLRHQRQNWPSSNDSLSNRLSNEWRWVDYSASMHFTRRVSCLIRLYVCYLSGDHPAERKWALLRIYQRSTGDGRWNVRSWYWYIFKRNKSISWSLIKFFNKTYREKYWILTIYLPWQFHPITIRFSSTTLCKVTEL